MQTPALLRTLAAFTGLYTDDDIIARVTKTGKCNTRESSHPMKASTDETTAEQALAAAEQKLTPLFAEYDRLLAELTSPALKWD